MTTADVVEIRRRRLAGELLKNMAKAWGVGTVQIHRIVHGQRWAHVPLVERNGQLAFAWTYAASTAARRLGDRGERSKKHAARAATT